MPTIYPNKTLTATSADILNAIRNSATNDYKNYIPVVTADAEIIRSVGSILMQNPSLMNEFLSALCNRIGKVLINSRLYNNPWAVFKKGVLEFGEVVEDIFVNIATYMSSTMRAVLTLRLASCRTFALPSTQ